MKEIGIKSKARVVKLFFENNIFIRLIKLLFTPKKLLKKMVNYKFNSSKVIKIDWKKRSKIIGKYSVIDSQTPKNEFNYVTKLQKKFLFLNLKKFLKGDEKKILDFGCGAGRFSVELAKLSKNIKVLGVDTEKNLIKIAKPFKHVKYLHVKNLKDINGKFDIIFIANVLGGIEIKKLSKISNFIYKKLKKNGILLLNENTTNLKSPKKEILKEWSSRNENFYLKLFSNLNLKIVDSYKYLQNKTSIFIGRK